MKPKIALFASTMLNSATNAHFFHWATDSYSKHVALGDYYEGIVDLVDSYVEAAMGIYGKIEDFPNQSHQPAEPVAYLKSLQLFIRDARPDLPKDPELVNLLDGIADLVDTTVYKLVNLK